MDTRKVTTGALLLFVSSVILMESGVTGARTPLLVAAFASLGLAGGSLVLESARQVRAGRARKS